MSGQYDPIIIEFTEKQQGDLAVVSEDALFFRTLKQAMAKSLAVKRECVHHFEAAKPAIEFIRKTNKDGREVVLFMERKIEARPTTASIIAIKKKLPDQKIIMLTDETTQDQLVYLYELGVNNVITKPASLNNLIEKLAFTLRPISRLSQLVMAAKEYLVRKDPDKALAVADEILKLKPDSPAALMLRGDAFLLQDKREQAIAAYLLAHENSRLYLEPLKKLAAIFQDHNADQHLAYLEKLDKLSPLNTARKCELGKAHLGRGNITKAEGYFDQALKSATSEAMEMIGSVAGEIADAVAETSLELSEKYLTQVIRTKSDLSALTRKDMDTFNRLGIILRRQGKWRQAIENYEKALGVAPDEAGLHYNLGLACTDGDQMDKAVEYFEKALKLDPNLPETSSSVAYTMASISFKAGRLKMARELADTALKLNKGMSAATSLLKKIKNAEE